MACTQHQNLLKRSPSNEGSQKVVQSRGTHISPLKGNMSAGPFYPQDDLIAAYLTEWQGPCAEADLLYLGREGLRVVAVPLEPAVPPFQHVIAELDGVRLPPLKHLCSHRRHISHAAGVSLVAAHE